jgi:hypothetical protein
MCRSSSLPNDPPSPSGKTYSMSRSLAPAGMARRRLSRIRPARASSQSWRMWPSR